MKLEDSKAIRLLVDSYYGVQKVRVETANRRKALVKEGVPEYKVDMLHEIVDKKVLDIEKDIQKHIIIFMKDQPIYTEWLKGVKGIAEILAGGLVSGISDIGRFDTVSKLWKYCGMGLETRCDGCGKRLFEFNSQRDSWVEKRLTNIKLAYEKQKKLGDQKKKYDEKEALKRIDKAICRCDNPSMVHDIQKRRRGDFIDYSPFMKTLCWKVGESFVKTKGGYRKLYEDFRVQEDRDHPDFSDGRRYARAKRRTVKLFLAHIWVMWRRSEGLPERSPYVIEHGEHTILVEPIDD